MKSKHLGQFLLGGGLVLGAIVLYRKYKALGNLLFTPGQILEVGTVGNLPALSFSVLVQNTSSESVVINSFAGSVALDGTLIGNVFNFQPLYVPPNSQVPITVNVQLLPNAVVSSLFDAIMNKTFNRQLQIDGFANVLGFQLPIDLKIGL